MTPGTDPCPKCGSVIPAEAPLGLCPHCVLAHVATPTEGGRTTAPRLDPPSREAVAAAFPQLEIRELIGAGGMGFVYEARQPKLDRRVALKLLPTRPGSDPAFAERFHREARFLARLNHPNIVAVYDFGQSGDFCWLMMEFVDGVNLRQAMRAGRFSPAAALALVPKICEALQFAHDQGVLHRDIKPENILLDTRGGVKIADFGIAKLVGDERTDLTLTASGARLGTPHYMAPEQIERPSEVDHRADIFSLGVVFYELLTGELPLGRFAPPSTMSSVDPKVDEVVFRALAKRRELRQQSAGEVKTQVEGINTPLPSSTPPFVGETGVEAGGAPATPSGILARLNPDMKPLVFIGLGVGIVVMAASLVAMLVELGGILRGMLRGGGFLAVPVIVGGVLAVGALSRMGWRRRELLLVPLGLGPDLPTRGDRWLRYLVAAGIPLLAFCLIGQLLLGVVFPLARVFGPEFAFLLLVALVGGFVFVLPGRRHANDPLPDGIAAAAAQPWMRRAGFWFLLAGGVAIVPSILSWRSEMRVFHSGTLLLFSGIAFLMQRPLWRRIGLFTAALGLAQSFFSNLYVVVVASHGLLPPGWSYGIPGIPHSGVLAAGLGLAQSAAFALALWLLVRADFRTACGLPFPKPRRQLLERGIIGGLAALMLFSFFALLFLRHPADDLVSMPEPEVIIAATTQAPTPIEETVPSGLVKPVPIKSVISWIQVAPPPGQLTYLTVIFWSNGVPVALPGQGALIGSRRPAAVAPQTINWELQRGDEPGVWQLSTALLPGIGPTGTAARLVTPPDVVLEGVATGEDIASAPGERLRRWLYLPAGVLHDLVPANPPVNPAWGVSVDIEPAYWVDRRTGETSIDRLRHLKLIEAGHTIIFPKTGSAALLSEGSLAAAFRLARKEDYKGALAALDELMPEALANREGRLLFRLDDSAYEMKGDLDRRLLALKAIFAARCRDAEKLSEAQSAGGSLWPPDGGLELYDIWLDHFAGGSDMRSEWVWVKTSDLLPLQPGVKIPVTVSRRYKDHTSPDSTNIITGNWLIPR